MIDVDLDLIREIYGRIEQQRQKILANPSDPSWTEHVAEIQIWLRDEVAWKRYKIQL